jgi:hypothetical protein
MELLLENQELMDLGKGLRGTSIACRDGRCWITQEGDSRDHILRTGESFTIKASGRLIVTATEPCRLMLVKHERNNHQRQPAAALYGYLKNCVVGGF